MFFPGYFAPIRRLLPYVVTVPDTQFLDLETGLGLFFRKLYCFVVPRVVKVSDQVITISEFLKLRIVHHIEAYEEKIEVIPLAAEVDSNPEFIDYEKGEMELVSGVLED